MAYVCRKGKAPCLPFMTAQTDTVWGWCEYTAAHTHTHTQTHTHMCAPSITAILLSFIKLFFFFFLFTKKGNMVNHLNLTGPSEWRTQSHTGIHTQGQRPTAPELSSLGWKPTAPELSSLGCVCSPGGYVLQKQVFISITENNHLYYSFILQSFSHLSQSHVHVYKTLHTVCFTNTRLNTSVNLSCKMHCNHQISLYSSCSHNYSQCCHAARLLWHSKYKELKRHFEAQKNCVLSNPLFWHILAQHCKQSVTSLQYTL